MVTLPPKHRLWHFIKQMEGVSPASSDETMRPSTPAMVGYPSLARSGEAAHVRSGKILSLRWPQARPGLLPRALTAVTSHSLPWSCPALASTLVGCTRSAGPWPCLDFFSSVLPIPLCLPLAPATARSWPWPSQAVLPRTARRRLPVCSKAGEVRRGAQGLGVGEGPLKALIWFWIIDETYCTNPCH